MKVIEHISKASAPLISFEIVPPMRGGSIQDITNIVKAIQPYNPSWIDVTAHSANAIYSERPDGTIDRKIFRKRPGTLGICGIIQNRFKIDTVAHILCEGFTKEETEDAMIELNFLGVNNVLALKGDSLNFKKTISKEKHQNHFASELVAQICDMKKGLFLSEIENAHSLDFGVGVAGYPEKHFEAPNLKTDILYLKQKIDRGAEYVVTQMFFDNKKYFDFVTDCKNAGISCPIIPGIKIIKSVRQLTSLPRDFHINMPNEFVDEVMSNPEHVREIGIRWAIKQSEELLNNNVPSLHFYIMNESDCVLEVLKKVR